MKYLLALFLLIALPASSQGLCVPYLECKPLAVKAADGEHGTHLYWFTRAEAGHIDINGLSCMTGSCDRSAFLTIANQVLTSKLSPADAWRDNLTFTCDYSYFGELAGELPVCAERKALLVANLEDWLVGIPLIEPQWRVKVNGFNPTFPDRALVRPLQAGVLQSHTIGWVRVGTPCIVNSTFLQAGNDRWMPYLLNGNLRPVVLCERVQP